MVKNSVLIRNNLLKRGRQGSKNCVFCGQDASIEHLFFHYSFARIIWSLFKCAFDLRKIPKNLDGCFGRWIRSFPKENKKLVLVGVAALFWTTWKCRNNIAFERKLLINSIVQIKLSSRVDNKLVDIADKVGTPKGVNAGSKAHRAGSK